MKFLGSITRLRSSNFREYIFLVQDDYEDYGALYYGQFVKDMIYSFNQLTRNFNNFKKAIGSITFCNCLDAKEEYHIIEI